MTLTSYGSAAPGWLTMEKSAAVMPGFWAVDLGQPEHASRPGGMLVAVIAVTCRAAVFTWATSIGGLLVGVSVGGVFEDQRGRPRACPVALEHPAAGSRRVRGDG